MIYVKKMAIKMYEGSPGWSVKRNEYFINQIIADTKKTCISIVNDARYKPTDLRTIIAYIEQAEVKEK